MHPRAAYKTPLLTAGAANAAEGWDEDSVYVVDCVPLGKNETTSPTVVPKYKMSPGPMVRCEEHCAFAEKVGETHTVSRFAVRAANKADSWFPQKKTVKPSEDRAGASGCPVAVPPKE